MRLKLTLLTIFTTFYFSHAQVATDFTVYTTHGDSLTLYEDLLDQGKTVVIDIFFTTCPPCNSIAPLLEPLYQDWGGGEYDVEFIALSNWSNDDNSDVHDYELFHGHTYPGVGSDGGSLMAVAPYVNGSYGLFLGTPTFVVIAPDGTVNYDVRGTSNQNTIQELHDAIAATGAMLPDNPQPFEFPGRIQTFFDQDVSNLEVKLIDCNDIGDPNAPVFADDITNGTGRFVLELGQLPAVDACVFPYNNADAINGVSTFDILVLRKHLLNIEVLPDPLAMYSGDINNNGTISTIDLVYMRQVILGMSTSFPNNTSWRFVADNSVLIDPDNMDPYDFTAFKVGDLNGSADPTSVTGVTERHEYESTLALGQPIHYEGQLFRIPVFVMDLQDISGIQGTFRVDGESFQIKGIEPGQIDISNDKNTALFIDRLTFSWDAVPAIKINNDEPVFFLMIEAVPGSTDFSTDDLVMNNYPTPSLGISGNGVIAKLRLKSAHNSEPTMLVYPNPASDQISIKLNVDVSGEYHIGIYKTDGTMISGRSEFFEPQKTRIIRWNQLPQHKGIYYLKIDGPSGILTEKVVIH